ncbi:transposable element Tcb1 transposase [Trichonephila clavipes]|nr:transposable element Tcb1 transposase [Trichonephila clavipes]
MIWSCISSDGNGRFHVIAETLNVRKHISLILEPKLLPSTRDRFTNSASFSFQQDSAPCHILRQSKDWYCSEIIVLLSCPGNSPGINPIANL